MNLVQVIHAGQEVSSALQELDHLAHDPATVALVTGIKNDLIHLESMLVNEHPQAGPIAKGIQDKLSQLESLHGAEIKDILAKLAPPVDKAKK